MIEITNLSGRLGNQMFQFAFLYAFARDNNLPLVDNGLGYYYQDPKHFEKYGNQIKRLFSQNIPHKTDQVAIHVRRTDYVNNPFYVDLMETPYYRDAMAQFPDSQFVVFSDDIEWCKKQPIFADCEFSETLDLEEMNLMASCVGHIIANSTFSWWSAYISPYTKKVIAPKAWYSDKIERTFCPDTWLRI